MKRWKRPTATSSSKATRTNYRDVEKELRTVYGSKKQFPD
jgi:hypothetical protein